MLVINLNRDVAVLPFRDLVRHRCEQLLGRADGGTLWLLVRLDVARDIQHCTDNEYSDGATEREPCLSSLAPERCRDDHEQHRDRRARQDEPAEGPQRIAEADQIAVTRLRWCVVA